MSVDARVPDGTRQPTPRAGFRCDVCQRYVQTTDHGVCPHCGRAPLSVSPLSSRGASAISWTYVAGLVALLALLMWLAQ